MTSRVSFFCARWYVIFSLIVNAPAGPVAVVTASCLTAYAFYTLAPATIEKYQTTRLALTIPIVIYGIFRYLYLVHRKEQGGSPSDLLLTDRPLLAAVALWAVAVVVIVYTAPGIPVPRGR